ncbi:MAG TPA: sugar-binding protein, partial [Fimbriiglobus sp.]|nr:sugar-binding protein [Fimbriiglobus sp.]
VQFFDENRGVVAGDGTDAFPTGVFSTEDGGRSWTMLHGQRACSWHVLDFTDSKTGRVIGGCGEVREFRNGAYVPPPGFCQSAEPLPLPLRKRGCNLRLHGEQYLDQHHGWAVGELGTILGTTDNGKTWNTLKCGGQRAAVLFAHARPEAVPLGAVATLGKDGYRCATVCLTPSEEPRLSAAMRSCGGAAAEVDGSVLPPEEMAEMSTDPAKATRDEALLKRLVLAIRTWKPEVIVTDRLSPDAPAADQLVLMHMKEAFTLAADPKAFPEQIEKLGLAPHAAKKLYALAPDGQVANVTMDLTAFAPELGDAAKDFVEPAAMLLGSTPPNEVRFRLIAHRLPRAEQHTTLMQGIDLAEGGTARRKKASPVEAVAERQTAAELRRQFEKTLANPESVGGLEPALAQVIGGLGTMPPDMAARAAVSLGMRLANAGQWTAARELFAIVAEKYPAYPPSVEAVRWLLRYQASGEVRRRIELGQMPVFQKAAFDPVEPNGARQVSYSDPFTAKPAYRFASAEAVKQWSEACLNLAPALAAFGAGYALDPANNLAMAATQRKLGMNMDAVNQLKGLLRDPADAADGWQCRLADELRLLSNEAPKLTPTAECRMTSVRPMLDGKLDDECWKSAMPLAANAADGYAAEARFAFDDKFLYVAVTCKHPEGKQVPKAERRARDADLRGHDRVEVLLDLDRDYQTYYRLRVDQRGCVAEDCWGDRSWDPRWFVAVESTPTGWTAEAAVPLAELTGSPPAAGQAWAVNVVRVVPGVGVGSWGGPSDAAPAPAAMGVMRFVGK